MGTVPRLLKKTQQNDHLPQQVHFRVKHRKMQRGVVKGSLHTRAHSGAIRRGPRAEHGRRGWTDGRPAASAPPARPRRAPSTPASPRCERGGGSDTGRAGRHAVPRRAVIQPRRASPPAPLPGGARRSQIRGDARCGARARPRRGGGPTLGRSRAPGAGRRQLPSDATVLNATEPCTSQWRKRSTLHYGLPQEKSRNEKSGDRESRSREPNGAEGSHGGWGTEGRGVRQTAPPRGAASRRSRSVSDAETDPNRSRGKPPALPLPLCHKVWSRALLSA